jgi:hypothetical protein
MKEPTKEELLEKYASRPVTHYQQFDAFLGVEPGDPVVVPDEDGDALMGGQTYELMRWTNGPRVLVPDVYEPADIARALRKIADWVEEGLEGLREDHAAQRRREAEIARLEEERAKEANEAFVQEWHEKEEVVGGLLDELESTGALDPPLSEAQRIAYFDGVSPLFPTHYIKMMRGTDDMERVEHAWELADELAKRKGIDF